MFAGSGRLLRCGHLLSLVAGVQVATTAWKIRGHTRGSGLGGAPLFRPREQEHTWVLLKPLDPLNPVLMDPGQVTQ